MSDNAYPCPSCSTPDVEKSTIKHEFDYGIGADAVILEAVVEIYECKSCGEIYMMDQGMQAQHDAVVAHMAKLSTNK